MTPLVHLLTACLDRLIHPEQFGHLVHEARQDAREQLTTEAPQSGS
jgi:hypothetical protein